MYYRERAPILITFNQWVTEHLTTAVEGIAYAPKLLDDIRASLATFDTEWYMPMLVDGEPQLEKRFKLPYPNAEAPICTIEGFIDCATYDAVVDYKTGKDKPSVKDVENDLQFIIYHWAYSQLYGYAPDKIIYHRLRDHKQIIGREFSYEALDTILQAFLTHQTVPNTELCDDCPMYCGMRNYVLRTSTV